MMHIYVTQDAYDAHKNEIHIFWQIRKRIYNIHENPYYVLIFSYCLQTSSLKLFGTKERLKMLVINLK